MCFGDGGAGEIARQTRSDEQARQARIKSGMAKIAEIFDGGATAGTGLATSYEPGKTYYLSDGSLYTPPAETEPTFFARGGYSPYQGVSPQDMVSQGKLFTGVSRSGGFNEDFFANRAKAYTDYAMPQVDRAYKRAKDSMIYALDRSGLMRSSAGIDKNAELSGEFDQSRIDVANKAQSTANKARQDVENARGAIVSQLNATGDNEAAASAAIRQAQAMNQPEGFSPTGQLFQLFSQGLSAIGSNARNDYGGLFGGSRSPLFYSSSGSSRVVGG